MSDLGDNCEFCASKATNIDGEVAGVYGYSCLVIPKATLVVGNRSFRTSDDRPKHNYLDSKTRFGLLPSEINPQLFQDLNGRFLNGQGL